MIKISDSWKAQLAAKLDTIHKNLDKVPDKRWPFVVELLGVYKDSLATAMGSVKIRGGIPHMEVKGKVDKSIQWSALSPYTVAIKSGIDLDARGGYMSSEELQMVWDSQINTMNIWEYTGDTKEALGVHSTKNQVGFFKKPSVAEYAHRVDQGSDDTDYGPSMPARPLFQAIGILFQKYVESELASKQSPLYQKIVSEVTKAGLL